MRFNLISSCLLDMQLFHSNEKSFLPFSKMCMKYIPPFNLTNAFKILFKVLFIYKWSRIIILGGILNFKSVNLLMNSSSSQTRPLQAL